MKGSCRVRASAALQEGSSSFFSFAGDDLRIQLRYGQEPILLLPVCRVVGLPQYELSAGGVVAEIQPVEDSGANRPTVDCPSGLSGINASEANTKDP